MFIAAIVTQINYKINLKLAYFGVVFMAIKSLSIRIDDKMLDKLHVVADYEGRSANSQILILIRDAVEAYEAKHGEIRLDKKEK